MNSSYLPSQLLGDDRLVSPLDVACAGRRGDVEKDISSENAWRSGRRGSQMEKQRGEWEMKTRRRTQQMVADIGLVGIRECLAAEDLVAIGGWTHLSRGSA